MAIEGARGNIGVIPRQVIIMNSAQKSALDEVKWSRKLMPCCRERPMSMLQTDHSPHMLSSRTVCSSYPSLGRSPPNRATEVRDNLKPDNLSFTEIAKRVGEMWQALGPEEREPYEAQAGLAKEEYLIELTQYKQTSNYKEYAEYLADFKAKHPSKAGTQAQVTCYSLLFCTLIGMQGPALDSPIRFKPGIYKTLSLTISSAQTARSPN